MAYLSTWPHFCFVVRWVFIGGRTSVSICSGIHFSGPFRSHYGSNFSAMSTPPPRTNAGPSRSRSPAPAAAAAGVDILNRVKAIQVEVEDLKEQLGIQLRETESNISMINHGSTADDRENITLGLIALQTRLRRQRRQLDKVISMTEDLEKIAVEMIVLCT